MKDRNEKQNGEMIISLSRALQKIHKRSEMLFRQHHMTLPQFAVLEALYHKGALTIGELISVVLSSSGNMTVVIRNLEKMGWIVRKENPSDKRSQLISLTPDGIQIINVVFKQHMEYVSESLYSLSQEEKTTVIEILKKL